MGQVSPFTAQDFVNTVYTAGCQISMDGRGAWRDNVMVERLWRSVKYEHVYLTAYEGVSLFCQKQIEKNINNVSVSFIKLLNMSVY